MVDGVTRIALIADAAGAHLGLWELRAGAERPDG
jgi:predicted enzyme related to lactoylglutathione lyase